MLIKCIELKAAPNNVKKNVKNHIKVYLIGW